MRTEKIKFNKRNLDKFEPRKPDDDGYADFIWDSELPHFGGKIQAKIAFYAALRSPLLKRWLEKRVGHYDGTTESIHRGRAAARTIINAWLDGKPLPTPHSAVTFKDALPLFFETLNGRDTRREIEQKLEGEVKPVLGAMRLGDIRHEDIVTLLNEIASRAERTHTGSRIKSGGPHAARKTYTYLNPFFAWAAHERIGGLEVSPMSAVSIHLILKKAGPFKLVRKHLIRDTDLRAIWVAAKAFRYPYGPMIRMLLMVGARLDEVASLRRNEIDGDRILLVPDRTKTDQVHLIPITEQLRKLLDELPDLGPDSFMFSTTHGVKPVSGFSKFKRELDEAIAASGATITPWKVNDLRKRCRSGFSSLDVEERVAELAIGHNKRGMIAVYDLHEFEPQIRTAMERWQARLIEIVEPPPPANVEPLVARHG